MLCWFAFMNDQLFKLMVISSIVLILVVLVCFYERVLTWRVDYKWQVLILVVLVCFYEPVLIRITGLRNPVLILVVLVCFYELSYYIGSNWDGTSLNPCCAGLLLWTPDTIFNDDPLRSLNPCCAGLLLWTVQN